MFSWTNKKKYQQFLVELCILSGAMNWIHQQKSLTWLPSSIMDPLCNPSNDGSCSNPRGGWPPGTRKSGLRMPYSALLLSCNCNPACILFPSSRYPSTFLSVVCRGWYWCWGWNPLRCEYGSALTWWGWNSTGGCEMGLYGGGKYGGWKSDVGVWDRRGADGKDPAVDTEATNCPRPGWLPITSRLSCNE